METVYIIGIITTAIVILFIVWLLRKRITSGRVKVDGSKKKFEAEFKADSTEVDSIKSDQPIHEKQQAVNISGNWLIGANVIRVLRDSVSVVKNRLIGKSRIEVKKDSPKLAPKKTIRTAKERKN